MDIRVQFLSKCHTIQNDYRATSPNGYSPHISYILWPFPNIILFRPPLNRNATLSKKMNQQLKLFIFDEGKTHCTCLRCIPAMFLILLSISPSDLLELLLNHSLVLICPLRVERDLMLHLVAVLLRQPETFETDIRIVIGCFPFLCVVLFFLSIKSIENAYLSITFICF